MSLFDLLRQWTLVNEDTFEIMKGQFEAEEVTEERAAAYAERFTLNRQNAILQFLHGITPTISFRGRFYNQTITGGAFPTFDGPKQGILANLLNWTDINPKVSRPPTVIFWVGDGHLQQRSVIESITGIKYDQPGALGKFKGVTFNVNLRKFTPFDIDEVSLGDTRHAVAAAGDYYELLAWREYRNANLGVHLRQQHPTQPNLQITNVVKLPAPAGKTIRRAKTTQTSVIFKTAYGREPTDQRERRLAMLAARNKTQVSHVVLTGSGLGG